MTDLSPSNSILSVGAAMKTIYINVIQGCERVDGNWVSLGPFHETLEKARTAKIYEFDDYQPASVWRESSRYDHVSGRMFNAVSGTWTRPVETVRLERRIEA
jgi:hypothetical protein